MGSPWAHSNELAGKRECGYQACFLQTRPGSLFVESELNRDCPCVLEGKCYLGSRSTLFTIFSVIHIIFRIGYISTTNPGPFCVSVST